MIHIFDIVGWLTQRHIPIDVALSAERLADIHESVAVPASGLVTYEFARTWNSTVGSTGYNVRVRNALL